MWDPSFIERSPIFWPLRSATRALAPSSTPGFPPPERIDEALAPRSGVRFERQRPVPRRRRRAPRDPSTMYDARIRAGCVPTRPGSWHDLMNALVWATFPKAKRALHDRQFELVVPALPGESARRPRELDTLALLDEGGLLVVSAQPPASEEALVSALADRRATAILFGHAIYEGLVLGRPMPLASVVCLGIAHSDRRHHVVHEADEALASILADRSQMLDPGAMLRLRVDPTFFRAEEESPPART